MPVSCEYGCVDVVMATVCAMVIVTVRVGETPADGHNPGFVHAPLLKLKPREFVSTTEVGHEERGGVLEVLLCDTALALAHYRQ